MTFRTSDYVGRPPRLGGAEALSLVWRSQEMSWPVPPYKDVLVKHDPSGDQCDALVEVLDKRGTESGKDRTRLRIKNARCFVRLVRMPGSRHRDRRCRPCDVRRLPQVLRCSVANGVQWTALLVKYTSRRTQCQPKTIDPAEAVLQGGGNGHRDRL